MSRVWLAIDLTLNKQWAVKEINKNSEEFRKTVNEDKTRSENTNQKKRYCTVRNKIVKTVHIPIVAICAVFFRA